MKIPRTGIAPDVRVNKQDRVRVSQDEDTCEKSKQARKERVIF